MWQHLALPRIAETVILAALVVASAWPAARVLRWRWASSITVVWLGLLVITSGPLPVLSVVVLLAAATSLGGAVWQPTRPGVATILGLALLAGVIGWLLPFPLHKWWTYAALLAAIVAWRWRALREGLSSFLEEWRSAVDASPRVAASATLVAGLATAGAWLPTMQFDDLAYHLGLPWQLQETGLYALDPTHQVWALAPWAGDVLHAIAQVTVHAEARGPLNVAWLALTGLALWKLGDVLGLIAPMRWACIALFASLPLVVGLQASMQTETAATAVTATLAAHIAGTRQASWRYALVCAALVGLLIGLKISHAAAALPLLIWAAWRGRQGVGPYGVAASLGVAFFVGASSYMYAWLVADNPFLPLMNARFESPYFPLRNFEDLRWHAGLHPDLPWRMTFETSRYIEAGNGGIGFLLVGLAGAAMAALTNHRSRALALCALLAASIPLLLMQYARYAHPGLVLMLPAMVGAVQSALTARLGMLLLAGLCALNIAFHTNSNWMLRTGAIKRSLAAAGRDAPLLENYTPERMLIAAIREKGNGVRGVLLLSPAAPAHAELGTRGRTTAWYSPTWQNAATAADRDLRGGAWAALWRREGISDLILRPKEVSRAQANALALSGARRVHVVGEAEWWQLPPAGAP